MYLEYFGLREFPFSLAPDPRFLFLSAQHREALAHLLYGVRSEGGFVQLTGEVGTGKTTVCRCFLEQLPPGSRAAVILNPALGAEELFAAICDEFRIARPEGAASVKTSLDLINRFLLEVHAAGDKAVLVIDEAQTLGAPVLEQVRLLTNLETNSRKLLQIILMGQPELRATLARPELRQLAQRITARFHLGALSRAETAAYVGHRLEVAGSGEEIFPAPVIGRLRRLSRGVPRMINILCDRALLGAYVQGKRQVDRATLAQAAGEVAGETPWAKYRGAAAVVLGILLTATALIVLSRGLARTPAPFRPGAVAAPSPVPPASASATAAAPDTVSAGAGGSANLVQAPAPRPRALPPVSGVLRALMDQPEAQRQGEAWGGLYRLWGIGIDGAGGDGCAQALRHGLSCLRGEGGLEQLRRLNRPAIVRVHDAAGGARWLVLEKLQGRQVTLAAGGARTAVDIDKLAGYDIGEFVLLWNPGGRGTAGAGGTATDPERLLMLDGDPAPGTPMLAGPR
jgi:general secretion pathway protein A